ncbi:hypothetical protein SK128_028271 [Halocaridina rubra]|uniref:G-protein coupled receptors family 1 profile domain-containing protein n=1 Tax=Halocaridina rubra TaxID=373956 RepID=A0AAN8XK52_HALRR
MASSKKQKPVKTFVMQISVIYNPFRAENAENETCTEQSAVNILGEMLNDTPERRDRNCSDFVACSGVPQTWALYFGTAFTGLTSLVGVTVNAIALVLVLHTVIHREKQRRRKVTAQKVFVLNLIVVDLLYCAVAMPFFFVTYITAEEPLGCTVGAFIRYVLNVAEFSFLSIIAFEKCYGILKASRHLFTLHQAIYFCVVYWIICISLQIFNAYKLGFGFNTCMFRCDILDMRMGRVLVFVLEGMLPMSLLIASYWMVLLHVLQHRRKQPVTCSTHEQRKVSRRTGRAVRSLFQHMYLVTVLPATLYNILDVYGKQRELGILCYCPLWMLFIINPMTFVFSDKQNKKTFQYFYHRLTKRKSAGDKSPRRNTFLFTVSSAGYHSSRDTKREDNICNNDV